MTHTTTRALVTAIREGTQALRDAACDLDRGTHVESSARVLAREADTLSAGLAQLNRLATIPDDDVDLEAEDPEDPPDIQTVLRVLRITDMASAGEDVRCQHCDGLLPGVLETVDAHLVAKAEAYAKSMSWPGKRPDC